MTLIPDLILHWVCLLPLRRCLWPVTALTSPTLYHSNRICELHLKEFFKAGGLDVKDVTLGMKVKLSTTAKKENCKSNCCIDLYSLAHNQCDQIWRNTATLENIFRFFAPFFFLGGGVYLRFSTYLAKFNAIGNIFLLVNGKILTFCSGHTVNKSAK